MVCARCLLAIDGRFSIPAAMGPDAKIPAILENLFGSPEAKKDNAHPLLAARVTFWTGLAVFLLGLATSLTLSSYKDSLSRDGVAEFILRLQRSAPGVDPLRLARSVSLARLLCALPSGVVLATQFVSTRRRGNAEKRPKAGAVRRKKKTRSRRIKRRKRPRIDGWDWWWKPQWGRPPGAVVLTTWIFGLPLIGCGIASLWPVRAGDYAGFAVDRNDYVGWSIFLTIWMFLSCLSAAAIYRVTRLYLWPAKSYPRDFTVVNCLLLLAPIVTTQLFLLYTWFWIDPERFT